MKLYIVQKISGTDPEENTYMATFIDFDDNNAYNRALEWIYNDLAQYIKETIDSYGGQDDPSELINYYKKLENQFPLNKEKLEEENIEEDQNNRDLELLNDNNSERRSKLINKKQKLKAEMSSNHPDNKFYSQNFLAPEDAELVLVEQESGKDFHYYIKECPLDLEEDGSNGIVKIHDMPNVENA